MLPYPERSLAEWQPDQAVAKAQKEITAGNTKIYFSGTRAAYPPGVSSGRYSLAKSLPNADVGIRCVIEEVELRNAQFEYARR